MRTYTRMCIYVCAYMYVHTWAHDQVIIEWRKDQEFFRMSTDYWQCPDECQMLQEAHYIGLHTEVSELDWT